MEYRIYNNDCLKQLDELEENSIDSIVTDPPYELNFMGKGWDNAGISFNKEIWKKCLKVLKPGGYLLAFGGSRTFHRIACAIEDAGFEIRDTIMWLYGSGFPKSMDISKSIDKKEGAQGEKIGERTFGKTSTGQSSGWHDNHIAQTGKQDVFAPATDLAKQWQGWGTALKPSFEPIIVARKPFKGSLVDNVIEYGVGGINIDECRVESNIESDPNYRPNAYNHKGHGYTFGSESKRNIKDLPDSGFHNSLGRFPANTILTYDDTDFDEVCGGFPNTKSIGGKQTTRNFTDYNGGSCNSYMNISNRKINTGRIDTGYIAPCDSGSASRYFYCAKASKKDRDEGLDEFELKGAKELLNREENSDGASWNGKYSSENAYAGAGCPKKNTHPTVKPTELMQYLVRLVNPKGGTILDPFMGSGSTGKAVMYENKERNADYKFIGIEKEKEYCDIAEARIKWANEYKDKKENNNQISFEDLK